MVALLALTLLGVLNFQDGAAVTSSPVLRKGAEAQRKEVEAHLQRLMDDAHRRGTEVPIEFTGNKNFPNQELLGAMRLLAVTKPCRTSTPFVRLSEEDDECGNSYHPEKLRDDLERVRFFLGTKGYLQAKIGDPKIEDYGDGPKIVIPVEEGHRYWIGELKVTGAKIFSPEQIIQMTGLRTGEIASAEVIRKGVYEEIKRAYGSRGYIQADVGLEPTFKDGLPWAQEGVVDLTIEVEEGEAFFIRSIKFPGLIHTSEQLLRDQLLIWEGGIYSTELLLESIKRMNQLGVVEEIREKDLITRIDSRALQVDLDIQVKEKRKPF